MSDSNRKLKEGGLNGDPKTSGMKVCVIPSSKESSAACRLDGTGNPEWTTKRKTTNVNSSFMLLHTGFNVPASLYISGMLGRSGLSHRGQSLSSQSLKVSC